MVLKSLLDYDIYPTNFLYACLELRFPEVETNPGPWRPVPGASRILCSNVRGLSGNLSSLEVASSQYDLLLCSETLFSDRRHISELLVPGFGRPILLCRDGMPSACGMAAYVRDAYGAFRPKYTYERKYMGGSANSNTAETLLKVWRHFVDRNVNKPSRW